jgi:mannose PTS system EIIA component
MGILLLTQGNLARELLVSAQAIAGGMEDFKAIGLDWRDGLEEGRQQVRAALDEMAVKDGEETLILTDMFGSTPCNVALSFRETGKVEIVAGVNLPMVVRLGCLRRMDLNLEETAEWLRDKGRRSICIADPEDDSGRCGGTVPSEDPCQEPAAEKGMA